MPLLHSEDGVDPGKPVMYLGAELTLGRAFVEACGWLLRQIEQSPFSLAFADSNKADSFTVWRDAPNTFCHADGTIASNAVAPLVLQLDFLDALQLAARLKPEFYEFYSTNDKKVDWAGIRDAARQLQRRIFEMYSTSDHRGFFLADGIEMGINGRARRLEVPTIDLGRSLNSGLFRTNDQRAANIVRILMSNEFLTPFGLRGRSNLDPRYSDNDYHCRVWLKASGEAAQGMLRHGFSQSALEIYSRCMRQTADGFFPENVSGSNEPELDYIPRVVTIRRETSYFGKSTINIKERPAHLLQTWSIGHILAADELSRSRLADLPSSALDAEIVSKLRDRAYRTPSDLSWDASGTKHAEFRSTQLESADKLPEL